MKIKMCESLEIATKVLKAVNRIGLPDDRFGKEDLWIETFDNCREQGYMIHYWGFRNGE